jgi:hypothetical protein
MREVRPRWRFEPSTERAGSVGVRSPGAAGSPPEKCGAKAARWGDKRGS